MTEAKMFGAACWVGAGDGYTESSEPDLTGKPHFPILRSRIPLGDKPVRKAALRAVGLGFCHCRVNGVRVTSDEFLPLATDYEPRAYYPLNERIFGHRILVPEFDVTGLLHSGENVLTIHFGGGWYTMDPNRFGDPKAIYRLTVDFTDGTSAEFVSSRRDELLDSFVKTNRFASFGHPIFETQDLRGFDEGVFTGAGKGIPAVPMTPPKETDYGFSDCPADRVAEEIAPAFLGEIDGKKCYDAGKNLSGWPVLRLEGEAGETVTVDFSEERNEDGSPDERYHFRQRFTVTSDGKGKTVRPQFQWFGFRYFSVSGKAQVERVEFVHANVAVNSSFRTDNETLNWIYQAYVHTQLSNMHAGLPSDCPHIEKRGYTGDGQLTCNAVMTMMDARNFYEKWIRDISDCQDLYSGHIQHTAPYHRSGGGPGGWGSAIVEVPYQFYRHYGDFGPFAELYPQMLRYFTFLEENSVGDLVVSEKGEDWCLGEWCAPGGVVIPASFINTWFYIRSLERMIEMAPVVGRETDLPLFRERLSKKRAAMTATFENPTGNNHNFFGGLQGANAIAILAGLGDEETYTNLVKRYRTLGKLDTGIFGTEAVPQVLFANGDGKLAAELLASTEDGTFDHWRRLGATTLWEYWAGDIKDRSHSHPMFGAAAAFLFSELAGIHGETPGYRELRIQPVLFDGVTQLSCSQTIPAGRVTVEYVREGDKISFKITIPGDTQAKLVFGGEETFLYSGENVVSKKL